MTGYIPDHQAMEAGRSIYSSNSPSAVARSQAVTRCRYQDSIAEAESQTEAQHKKTPGLRAQLPAPHSKLSDDTLTILATAFCKAFDAMGRTMQEGTLDYTKLMELDQTQTKCVLDSANLAIKKEGVAQKMASDIAQYQEYWGKVNEYFGWVMGIVGAVVVIGTFASGFADGFASDAALPEEIELFDLGGEADADLDAEFSSAEDVSFSDGDDLELDALDSSDIDEESSESQSLDETEQTVEKDLESSSSRSAASEEGYLKKGGRILLKLGIGAGFGSPMLLKGISSYVVAHRLQALSQAQSDVGTAMGLQQRNNMYFQFLQQILQREGGMVTQEVDGTGDVIQTFGEITNAYRSIAQGLANAV